VSGVAAYLFRLVWLVGTVFAGAFLWYAGDARLGIALLVVGLGWLFFGFVLGFAETFVRVLFEELQEG